MKLNKIYLSTSIHEINADEYCVPIRKNEDGEFFLLSELSAVDNTTFWISAETDRKAGEEWAKANPVVRYQNIKLVAFEIQSPDNSTIKV